MSTTARQNREKKILLQMAKDWGKALERKDLDALVANCHRHIHLFDIQPPYQIKGIKAYRAVWKESLAMFPDKFRSRHKNIRFIVDGNTAVMHCLHRIEPAGAPALPWVRATIVYSKQGRQWQVTHEHISWPVEIASGRVAPIDTP